MKKNSVFILLIVMLPIAAAFTYDTGENRTLFMYCVNASTGALLGTEANLTVRNVSGIFFEVNNVENVATGTFKQSFSNFSDGHCYSLILTCEDADTYKTEWGSLCVNQSTSSIIIDDTEAGYAGLGSIIAAVGMIILFLILNKTYNEKYPLSQIIFVPMIMFALMIATYAGARIAEDGGAPLAVSTAMDRAYLGAVVSMIVVMFTCSYATLYLAFNVIKESRINKLH